MTKAVKRGIVLYNEGTANPFVFVFRGLSNMRKLKHSSLKILLLVSAVVFTLTGCGDGPNDKDAVGPPIPDSPRAINPDAGAPLLLFGGGSSRPTPGEEDEEYREYLLWKEWQEYQKYQEWLKSNPNRTPSGSSGSE